MIFAADEIASQARPLPRDWGRLIQKLPWIGPPNAAVLVDETLPSRLGTLSACNVRIAIGTGIARFDFLFDF